MSVFDLLDKDNYIENERIVRERVNTCIWCPEYIKFTGQCFVCGCFVKAKAKLKTEDCPIGKWKKLD